MIESAAQGEASGSCNLSLASCGRANFDPHPCGVGGMASQPDYTAEIRKYYRIRSALGRLTDQIIQKR